MIGDPATMTRAELNQAAIDLGVSQKPEAYVTSHLRIRVEKAIEREATGQTRRRLG